MKVAIYCRASITDKSCQRQERELNAHARKAGWKVVAVRKETASSTKGHRKSRQEVLVLAKAKKIDIVLVTELTRWSHSTLDLLQTLQKLQSCGVSLIAQSGLQFDLRTAQGKLAASILPAFAEFQSNLVKERIKKGMAAAKASGKILGRKLGHYIKSDRLAPKVVKMVDNGMSYRRIAALLNISKTTVVEIMKRHRKH